MISPFANLFLALQQYIGSLQSGSPAAPIFKTIDQDLGQLEAHYGDMRVPVLWPCCLIDVDSFRFDDMSNNGQNGNGYICIRLGFPPFSASNIAVPAEYVQKALGYYELEQQLHQALQGWCPGDQEGFSGLADIFGPLTRVSSITEQRSDIIRVRKIMYRIAITDFSTQPGFTLTSATPNISLDI